MCAHLQVYLNRHLGQFWSFRVHLGKSKRRAREGTSLVYFQFWTEQQVLSWYSRDLEKLVKYAWKRCINSEVPSLWVFDKPEDRVTGFPFNQNVDFPPNYKRNVEMVDNS